MHSGREQLLQTYFEPAALAWAELDRVISCMLIGPLWFEYIRHMAMTCLLAVAIDVCWQLQLMIVQKMIHFPIVLLVGLSRGCGLVVYLLHILSTWSCVDLRTFRRGRGCSTGG